MVLNSERPIFDSSFKPNETMTTITKTKENNARVKALKKISNTKWSGNTTHVSLVNCLTGINLYTNNGGLYNPVAARINGLNGIYLINKDGSIFCEARVIKENDKKFKIEWLTSSGYSEFEDFYLKFLEEE